MRIAVSLHLSVRLCRPHTCHLCGAAVDEQATYGLSCVKSAGLQSCRVAINDIVKRSLSSAQIPFTLEPTRLCRTDGKRPDGVIIASWKTDCMLVWDASCTDSFATWPRVSLGQELSQGWWSRGRRANTRTVLGPITCPGHGGDILWH